MFRKFLISLGLLFCLCGARLVHGQVKTCIITEGGDTINCSDIRGQQGLWLFYKGKRKIAEVYYKNGLKNGSSIKYYSKNSYLKENFINDTIVDSSFYYLNDKIKECKVYDRTGEIKTSITYYDNLQPEFWTQYISINNKLYPLLNSYYKNGKPRMESKIIDSLQTVETTFYDKNGNKRK